MALASAALAGFLMFTGAPHLRADDDDCQRRIAKADHKLHEASSITVTKVGRPNTGAMSCAKSGSAAGTVIIDGGMKTGIAGIRIAIGMITTMITTAITAELLLSTGLPHA
ncbi:MAG: hypothetical protein WBC04_24395 [Candidatus Acidiferrales bacterium]